MKTDVENNKQIHKILALTRSPMVDRYQVQFLTTTTTTATNINYNYYYY